MSHCPCSVKLELDEAFADGDTDMKLATKFLLDYYEVTMDINEAALSSEVNAELKDHMQSRVIGKKSVKNT